MFLVLDRLATGGPLAPPRLHVQEISPRPVHILHEIQDPVSFLGTRLEQRGSCGIAEQHAGVAILVIDDGAHDIGSDHQDLVVSARLDHLGPRGEGKDKGRTSRGQVKAPGPGSADLLLHQTGGRREEHVGSDGSHDDGVDVFGRGPRPLETFPGGPHSHKGAAQARFQDPSFADSRTGHDPLVGGIHHLFKFPVRHAPLRKKTAHGTDVCMSRRRSSICHYMIPL